MLRGKGKRLVPGVVCQAAFPVVALLLLASLAVLLGASPAEAQAGLGDRVPIVPQKRDAPAGPAAPTFRPVRLVYRQTEGGPFKKPTGVSVEPETGDVLVVDSGNHLVTLLSRDGVPLFSFGYNGETPQPSKALVDKQGRILVICGAPPKVRVFSYRGEALGEFGFPGFEGAAQVVPTALAIDAAGNLYVADATSGLILVYAPEGRMIMRFGRKGEGPGAFQTVTAIAVDSSGTIYVADARNAPAIQIFDAQGTYLRGWGEHSSGPQNVSLPSGLGVDVAGHILVLDTIRQTITVFTSEGRYLSRFGGLGPGPGNLGFPSDLAMDGAGRLYVTEVLNARLQVFEPMAAREAPRSPSRGAREMPQREREEIRRSLGDALKEIKK